MERNLVALDNIPTFYSEELMTEYIEATLEVDVRWAKIIEGLALFSLMHEIVDFKVATKNIEQKTLEGRTMLLLGVDETDAHAVVIYDINPRLLDKRSLKIYIEQQCKRRKDCITDFRVWLKYKMGVVRFRPGSEKVVRKLIIKEKHQPLHGVNVVIQPYYLNFHDLVEKRIQSDKIFLVKGRSQENFMSKFKAGFSSESDSVSGDDKENKNHRKLHFEQGSNEDIGDQSDRESHSEQESNENSGDQSERESHSEQESDEMSGDQCDRESHSEQESNENSGVQSDRESHSEQESDEMSGDQSDRESQSEQESNENSGVQSDRESHSEQESDEMSGDQSDRESHSEQESDENSGDQSEREIHSEQESDEITKREGHISKITGMHKNSCSGVTRSGNKNTHSESGNEKCEKTVSILKRKVSTRRGNNKTARDDTNCNQDVLDKELYENNIKQAKSKIESFDSSVQSVEAAPLCLGMKILPMESKELEINEAQFVLLKKHFGIYDNCIVKFIKAEKIAVFEGDKKESYVRYSKMLEKLRKIETDQIDLLECSRQLLTEDNGKLFIEHLCEPENVAYCIENDALLLASKTFNSLKKVAKQLREVLNFKNTFKVNNCNIPLEAMNILKTKLEKELLVKVSWSVNQEEIFVEGVKDDVLKSTKDINTTIEKFSDVTKKFIIPSSSASYILLNRSNKIKSIFNKVNNWNCTDDPVTYTFTGQHSAVIEAERSLQLLVDSIVTHGIDFQKECFRVADIKLIASGLKTEQMKYKIKAFEKQENCLLKIQLPGESCFLDKNKQPERKPNTFTVDGSCRIQIKSGNIVTEKSEVLVCVLDESFNLKKTQVGRAFFYACPRLNGLLKTVLNENPSSLVHIVKGPFSPPLSSCVSIIGVVLNTWNESYSPNQLKNIITNVLDEAVRMGAKSVSLPTLGHGRLFKFPTKVISQIMIDTVHSYAKSDQAQIDVVIVTYDQEMLDALKDVASQSLQAYSSDTLEISDTSDNECVVNLDKKKILDLVTSGDLEISVTMAKVDEPKKTLQKLTDLIKRKCLYTVQFEHMMISVLELEIEEKAKNQLVLIRKSTVAETGDRKIVIKGFIKHVKEIKKFIKAELSNFQSVLKNKSLSATDAPSRGTKDFLHYAAKVTEICPSYWTFCKKPSFLTRLLGTRNLKIFCKEKKHEIIVPVDKATKKAIIDVFEKTWNPKKSGVGKDARGLSEGTKCEVLNVERIENPALFELYAQTRKNLFEKYGELEKLCDDFSKTLKRGQVKTTEILPSTLREQLYYEVNEHYLFHGTKKSLIEALCQHGPDPKLCTNAMLGNGLYMAEESLKSDQYTDEKAQRTSPGEELNMILMRVLLGNTYVITRDREMFQGSNGGTAGAGASSGLKLKRPPCAQCQKDLCANVSHLNCDSVTLDGSPDDMRVCFREFVVYDKSMCYPEYIITYRRKLLSI